jgi:hypothetical protein
VDWNDKSIKGSYSNALLLPRWKGNDDDQTLVELAVFLRSKLSFYLISQKIRITKYIYMICICKSYLYCFHSTLRVNVCWKWNLKSRKYIADSNWLQTLSRSSYSHFRSRGRPWGSQLLSPVWWPNGGIQGEFAKTTCKPKWINLCNVTYAFPLPMQEQEVAKQQQLQHEEKKGGPLTSSFLKRR